MMRPMLLLLELTVVVDEHFQVDFCPNAMFFEHFHD